MIPTTRGELALSGSPFFFQPFQKGNFQDVAYVFYNEEKDSVTTKTYKMGLKNDGDKRFPIITGMS